MTGTTKQVEWASKIAKSFRAELAHKLHCWKQTALHCSNMSRQDAEKWNDKLQAAFDTIVGVQIASWWIDRRYLSAEELFDNVFKFSTQH